MVELLRIALGAIVAILSLYFAIKGFLAPISSLKDLLPSVKGMKLRAIYLTIATVLGLLATEIYLPNIIWFVLLPLLLVVIWAEYLIYLVTWHK